MTEKTLTEVFGITAPAHAKVKVGTESNILKDSSYVFRPWLIKLLLIWWSGSINKRLYLFGPTGSGKSTVIEQFGACMGVPVYRVGVHNRLEFSETLGSVQLVSNQAPESNEPKASGKLSWVEKIADSIKSLASSAVTTKFINAELGQALSDSKGKKVIVLIDEVDQGNPSQNMAWNKLLDECSITLPTGEVISPENIWVAATGNTGFEDERGLYRGVQRQNIAFKSRFGLHEEIDYPSSEIELAILKKVAPSIPEEMTKVMVNFAIDMRKLFVDGELDVPLATRTLINWAKTIQVLSAVPGMHASDRALELVYANQCSSVDKQKILGAWQRISGS